MTKLDDALLGVTRLGFDTPPFIYFVERNPAYVDLVRAVLQRIDAGQIAGYSSAVTLTEVLTQPKRSQNIRVENEYRDLLLRSRNFLLATIDFIVAGSAADLRARYQLRTPDALQMAVAINVGCEAINSGGILRV